MERNIQIDINTDYVELSLEDFEYIIDAALAHEDRFFLMLMSKMDEIFENESDKLVKN